MDQSITLTETAFQRGLEILAVQDADLAKILSRIGPPPFWRREPGFATLVLIILEQQVSLASARAAYDRLLVTVSPLTPERFLELGDQTLKEIGFSHQKTAYCRGLAQAMLEGEVDLNALKDMKDSSVRSVLLELKGIGTWTAENYLLMALRRSDAWPRSDLALMNAAQHVKRLPALPTAEQMDQIGEPWRPWRAVAARILWHFYLNGGKPI